MLKLKNVSKKYDEVTVLNNINLEVGVGEFLAITGQSGSGKTTLINIMGMITSPDNGDVIISEVINPKGKQLRRLRKNRIGYLFQNYFLIDEETVENNLRLSLSRKDYKRNDAISLLEEVNLDSSILNKKVYQLSGGEQQRVALVRALLKDFDILLADEPTGNLDKVNKDIILSVLKRLKNSGKSVVCVTHDQDIALSADRVIELKVIS